MNPAKYRKLAVVIGGLLVLAAGHFGFDLSGQEQAVVDLIVSLGIAFGVYQVPNEA